MLKITKMHGIGNDYIYVNCFEESVPDPSRAARGLSDRHFWIGSDGLVLIKPSDIADFEMDMYNSDGSRAEMQSAAWASTFTITGLPIKPRYPSPPARESSAL